MMLYSSMSRSAQPETGLRAHRSSVQIDGPPPPDELRIPQLGHALFAFWAATPYFLSNVELILMDLQLDNKLALVTASTGGIGKEIAVSLAREGPR